jgi:hypothetical protein
MITSNVEDVNRELANLWIAVRCVIVMAVSYHGWAAVAQTCSYGGGLTLKMDITSISVLDL